MRFNTSIRRSSARSLWRCTRFSSANYRWCCWEPACPSCRGWRADQKLIPSGCLGFRPLGRWGGGGRGEDDGERELREPARAAGVAFDQPALKEVFRLTKGYPYFLQEWGYQAWNLAAASPITLQVVQNATATVIARLDKNFFRVRFDRLTP